MANLSADTDEEEAQRVPNEARKQRFRAEKQNGGVPPPPKCNLRRTLFRFELKCGRRNIAKEFPGLTFLKISELEFDEGIENFAEAFWKEV